MADSFCQLRVTVHWQQGHAVRDYATAETTMKNQYRQIKMLPLNNGNATAAVITLRLRKLIQNSQELINGDEMARIPAAVTARRIEDGTCGPQGPTPTIGPTARPNMSGKIANNTPYAIGLRRRICGMFLDIEVALLRGTLWMRVAHAAMLTPSIIGEHPPSIFGTACRKEHRRPDQTLATDCLTIANRKLHLDFSA
jgi:hypothetical protein